MPRRAIADQRILPRLNGEAPMIPLPPPTVGPDGKPLKPNSNNNNDQQPMAPGVPGYLFNGSMFGGPDSDETH